MLYDQEPRAVQRNAADPQQKKRAERIGRRQQDRLRGAIVEVMNTQSGRLLMWELLKTCGTFKSVWEPSAKIHYNAGRQDVGHEILADLVSAAPQLYQTMEREARSLAQREQDEIDASHTRPAAEEEDNPNG